MENKAVSQRVSWNEKVLRADSIWSQVKNILDQHGLELPQTPRRPDVRLILNNVSGVDQIFRNPANHAGDKAEAIPAHGDSTAVMVMLQGDTIEEQMANARAVVEKFNLAEEGLSDRFKAALANEALEYVKEAYGPAPFDGQSQKLVPVEWAMDDENTITVTPVFGQAVSYGVRAPAHEIAMRTESVIYVQGTNTTPEKMQSEGIVIAVSSDWQTGAESTRPIVPKVAEGFYGSHYQTMPIVSVNPDGVVETIDLRNGTVIDMRPDYRNGLEPNIIPFSAPG